MDNIRYSFKNKLSYILLIFIGLIIILRPQTISYIIDVLKPLIIAFAISYIVDSLVRCIVKRLKINRVKAIFLACILLVGIISMIFSWLIPKIIDNAHNVIEFIMNSDKFDFNEFISNLAEKYDNEYVRNFAKEAMQLSEGIKVKINGVIGYVSKVLMNIVTNIGQSIIIISSSFILALYMLIEKNDLLARLKRMIRAFFDKTRANMILETATSANVIFKSYLVGKLIDSMIVGIICISAFTIFKIPYAPLLGSIMGVFNIIPMFGPIIGAIPVVLVSFIVSPTKALTSLIIIVVVGQLDGNFLDPKIVGSNVGVSPFWVICAVLIGGKLLGPIGMVLGVPTTVLIKTTIENKVDIKLTEKSLENYELNSLKQINKKNIKKK